VTRARLVTIVLGAALAYAVVRFLGLVVLGPLQSDEMPFSHAAWLVARGERPYIDFFEHHNPAYLYIVSTLITSGSRSLGFIVAARFLSFAFALVTAAISSILVFRATAGATRQARLEAALLAAVLAIALQTDTKIFELRPDCLSIPFCVAAWAAVREAQAPDRRLAALGAGILLGITVGATIRAGILVAALFFLGAIPLARRRDLEALALLGAGSAAAFAISICSVTSPRLFLDWCVRFSGSLGPGHSVTTYALVPTWTNLLRGVIVLAAAAVAASAWARRARRGEPISDLAATATVLLVACAGPFVEKMPFETSLSFPSIGAALWLPLAAVRLEAHLLARAAPARARAVPALVIALGLATIAAAATSTRLLVERIATIPHLGDLSPSSVVNAEEGLRASLRQRAELGERFQGERVLSCFYLHPITVEDVSYWWYGASLVEGGTLERAGIVGLRPYTLVTDVLERRPGMISRSLDVLPCLRHAAAREGRLEALDKLLSEQYVARGPILIRRDLVPRFEH
jgi:hypothetical protein